MKQNVFHKIAIAGSGKMGSDLFFHLLHITPSMVWLCEDQSNAETARNRYQKKISRLSRIGIHEPETDRKTPERIIITSDRNAAAHCDLLLECIPEDAELKKDFFKSMDSICAPDCIFCTNSSSVLPSRLIPSQERGRRMAGMHFFYPVSMKKVTELVLHKDTSPDTAEKLQLFLGQQGFHVLQQDERHAFRLNRILLELQIHLSALRQNRGFSCHKIDVVINERLLPGGVFSVMDQIGFDVLSASVENYMKIDPATDASALLREIGEMMAQGRYGRKSGGGYYTGESDSEDSPTEEEEKMIFNESLRVLRQAVKKSLDAGDSTRESLEPALREYFGLEHADIFFE